MKHDITAFWHKESFDRFLLERLPQLLADRLPLVGYTIEVVEPLTRCINVTVTSLLGDISISFTNIPCPDEQGIFEIDGHKRVVVPLASQDNLAFADIICVGEQLYDYITARLGDAPSDLPWDESLARAWFPLDAWIHGFLSSHAQVLERTNWLATHQHLRRIFVKERNNLFTPGHFGRVCPFETPEGPNIGRYLCVAVGAAIREGKLVIVDDEPEAGLGLSATMIPFLEHDEPNKLLMGTNMMRQWLVPSDPEPALVQTGNEPDALDFWCGRNLLTAYISWGAETFEDGIIISESCAKRLNYPDAAEPGDKLSNRHGAKGVISHILSDGDMPHLADGTSVELVFSFIGLQRRLYFGQLREAIMGRIARAEGIPAVIPPFHAPGVAELREQLVEAHLSEDGMERLTMGFHGKPLQRPSTVGWVYWGRLVHTARAKLRVAQGNTGGQLQDELAYYALRNAGAFENIREHFNTCNSTQPDAAILARRVAEGEVEQSNAPTPMFTELVRRLAVAGIQVTWKDEKLTFRFAAPDGNTLKLAYPIAHPWLRERTIDAIGMYSDVPEFVALTEANQRLVRMSANRAPESLIKKALVQLETCVQAFFAVLLTSAQVAFSSRVLFSGRAVLVPGTELRIDQVGIANEIAWELFAPLVVRELGDEEEVLTRSERATRKLDEVMARSWLLIYRSPAHTPTAFLAFHPVRDADRVIRLHPLTCGLLNADFDGDQAAFFLPVTESAQREAGTRLSVMGHLRRDPALLDLLVPTNEALWGLANLSLTQAGCKEIANILSANVATPDRLLTKAALLETMQGILSSDGIARTLEVLERLMGLGFAAAKEAGASMNPFIGASLHLPPLPPNDHSTLAERYRDYVEEIAERLAARSDFADSDLGSQLLAVKSGALGQMSQLAWLVETHGTVVDIHGKHVPIQHGFSAGLTPVEMYALAVSSREALARIAFDWEQLSVEVKERYALTGYGVLARAMRSKKPGVVFAYAATNATGETDPLQEVDSRLFFGLPVKASV